MSLERLKRPKPTPLPPAPPPDADLAAPSPPGPGKAKGTAQPSDGPTVRFRCGHGQPLAHFAGMDCPPCRAERQKARAAQKRAKREAKQAAKPKAEDKGRLPDGAAVSLVYDATKVEWRGVLHIEGYPEFRASASGQFKCLTALDALYREAAGVGDA